MKFKPYLTKFCVPSLFKVSLGAKCGAKGANVACLLASNPSVFAFAFSLILNFWDIDQATHSGQWPNGHVGKNRNMLYFMYNTHTPFQ
jgi:hypothetical protein